jgi:hypothetical protein
VIYKEKASVLLVGILVFTSVFVASHLVYSLGFRASVVMLMSIFSFLFVLIVYERKIEILVLLLVLLSLVTSLITGLYWSNWTVALFPSLFCMSLLVASTASKKELDSVIEIGSVILLMMLLGAWVAFFIGIMGVPSLGTFYAAGGRGIEFYYTSLGIPYPGNFLRVTGIYDEPGSFSFIICMFAFFRHISNMDKKFTWILLLLGFVTFSLAHLIYVVIHLAAERNIFKTFRRLIIIGSVFLLAITIVDVWPFFEQRLFHRLEVSSDPTKVFVGDNRTKYLLSSIAFIKDQLDFRTFIFGADVSCIVSTGNCGQFAPYVGFNPFSPMILYGILISWPYYLFLLFALGFGVIRKEFWPLFAVALLFFQRPSMFSAGYATLAAMAIIVVVRSSSFKELCLMLIGKRQ